MIAIGRPFSLRTFARTSDNSCAPLLKKSEALLMISSSRYVSCTAGVAELAGVAGASSAPASGARISSDAPIKARVNDLVIYMLSIHNTTRRPARCRRTSPPIFDDSTRSAALRQYCCRSKTRAARRSASCVGIGVHAEGAEAKCGHQHPGRHRQPEHRPVDFVALARTGEYLGNDFGQWKDLQQKLQRCAAGCHRTGGQVLNPEMTSRH